jgi:anti-sigma factor RsiW
MRDRDDVRDLLPDLLHDRLTPDVAADVRAVIAGDPELAAEFAMLSAVSPALTVDTPALDLVAIVAALPAPPAQQDDLARRRAMHAATPRARRFTPMRFAQAAAFALMLGGGGYLAWRTGRTDVSVAVRPDSTVVASGPVQLGIGAAVDGLSEADLQALEAEIRALDGMPEADPELGMEEGA